MGITGLLPLLKSIHVHTHISEFSGQTLAVDGYVWLHRGAFACAPQLVKGEKTSRYVDYFMQRVRLLRHNGVEPFCVFDGGSLPAKKGTESDRSKKREENLAQANKLASEGRHSEARDYYTKCVDVTPEMAYQVIKGLKAEDVQYVVAPYEADAQLAYLEREGIVDGIITEDSDLLVFGCKSVLFKLDSDGRGVSIKREHFGSVKDAPMIGWGDKEFREMAMLSGCDYLPSIVGLGLKTAHRLLRRCRSVEKVLQHIRLQSSLKIPPGYLDSFRMAELAFLHQRVYDPRTKSLVHMNPINEEKWTEQMDKYVGSNLEQDLAHGIAEGSVDPCSLLPMKDINPGFNPKDKKDPKTHSRKKPAPASRNSITLDGFFTVIPKCKSTNGNVAPAPVPLAVSGNGMRTLSEQMDAEREIKQARRLSSQPNGNGKSRFFTTQSLPSPDRSQGPSRKRKRTPEGDLALTPRHSQRARSSLGGKENDEPIVILDSDDDPVIQEDGYRSPCGDDVIVDVSSPIERLSIADDRNDVPEDLRGDEVSSPPTGFTPHHPVKSKTSTIASHITFLAPSPTKSKQALTVAQSKVLVTCTPSPCQQRRVTLALGVDLQSTFRDEGNSDFGEGDRTLEDDEGPQTPCDINETALLFGDLAAGNGGAGGGEGGLSVQMAEDLDVGEEDELDIVATQAEDAARRVMLGWRTQWSHSQASIKPPLQAKTVPSDAFSAEATGDIPKKPTLSLAAGNASSASFKRRGPLSLSRNGKGSRSSQSLLSMKTDLSRSSTAVTNTTLDTSFVTVVDDDDDDDDIVEISPPTSSKRASEINLSQKLQSFRYIAST